MITVDVATAAIVEASALSEGSELELEEEPESEMDESISDDVDDSLYYKTKTDAAMHPNC